MDAEQRRYQFGSERYPEPSDATMSMIGNESDPEEVARQSRILGIMISRHALPWKSNRAMNGHAHSSDQHASTDEKSTIDKKVLQAFEDLKSGCALFLVTYRKTITKLLNRCDPNDVSMGGMLQRDLERLSSFSNYPGKDSLETLEIFYDDDEIDYLIHAMRNQANGQFDADHMTDALHDYKRLYNLWRTATA